MIIMLNATRSSDQLKNIIPFALGVALFSSYFYFYEQYKEISWREFVTEYLSKGNVTRLEVINKKWVKVISKNLDVVSAHQ